MDHGRTGVWPILAITTLGVAVVASAVWFAWTSQRDTELSESPAAFHPDDWDGASADVDPELYDPVRAGEPLPDGYRPIIARDGIRPVYRPLFVRGDDSTWPDNELVIGVEIDGDARAYPVGFLTRREIVVDLHRGIPTFVTW